MSEQDYQYPMRLQRGDIEQILPHRGTIFVCQQLTIEGPHQFHGVASWPHDNAVIQGHFPGMPIVPGVMLIESMAQFAGAGLLAGDPYVKTLPQDSVGVLAAVRNCWFKQPVLPGHDVEFFIQCRQMAPLLVQVNAQVKVAEQEVAKLEVALAYAPRSQLQAASAAG
ncbi:3-hydroxyacyl-ACP dehydratase FabZ family protein [Pseudogulbenkiania subflava]|uniref:3-hydroxyacyl-[acyl-carrier-protein] dehydratase n=1 Tax=Pseudogulbenkiania subflava DSM 22618 TaxID=1123014 RepID=A0A1Y6BRW1_9NEIS|nr:3-hydroxyacyl-ACP dehydratase [Pseudogulbenkiania subflava]SMF25880.1 3-hydroxyacyl-[acyl-carrier-protein] dehydratase [Pseudogulbenkiania subflava DSM 22618]